MPSDDQNTVEATAETAPGMEQEAEPVHEPDPAADPASYVFLDYPGNPYLKQWTSDVPLYDADENMIYICNTNSHLIHYQDCKSVKSMADKNKALTIDPDGLMDYAAKYRWCKNCGKGK